MVNKADINMDVAEEIEAMASKHGIVTVGRIPYDNDVTRAQIARKALVDMSDGPAAETMRVVWGEVQKRLSSVASSAVGGLVQITT